MNNPCGLLPNWMPVCAWQPGRLVVVAASPTDHGEGRTSRLHESIDAGRIWESGARVWVPRGKGGDWGRGRGDAATAHVPSASFDGQAAPPARAKGQRTPKGGGGGGLQGRRYWTPMMQGEPWLPAAGANHQAGGAPCELR
jgi:hypothetical protein